MKLNNTIATPLYKQLEEKIRKEIDAGERAAGSRLPTENELSESYHVSRVTVRKALAVLSESGYLERKSGKGTFVAEKKLQRNITEVISFSDMCRMKNATPGAKTIKIALEDPSERDLTEMSLHKGDKILVVERIRYMDNVPVILEFNKFPAKSLNISKGYPLLRISSTIHDVDNTITNLCKQLCIGDKFQFII